jgi:hypothetical protein
METPGNGTLSCVVGPSVSMPSFSDLKSVNRSFGVTWSKRGVSALYICACVSAPAVGSPYCPEGRMFLAMIVGSFAEAAGTSARNADVITPAAIHKRVPRISSLSSLRARPERGRHANKPG